MISVLGVSKVYDNGVEALRGVTFDVGRGETCSIIGPSGCGKSTLLLIMAGLLRPSSGKVVIEGEVVKGPVKNAALILQEYGLFPWKTVYDNIAIGLRIRGVPRERERRIVSDLIKKLGLKGFERRYPKDLSGGMKQRVAIARALALNPDILLMDEPFSSLDEITREKLQTLLLKLWKDTGMTVVMVTHSVEEAVFLGRKIVVMTERPGRVKGVIENPSAGRVDYRMDEEFFEVCREVRRLVTS